MAANRKKTRILGAGFEQPPKRRRRITVQMDGPRLVGVNIVYEPKPAHRYSDVVKIERR